MPVIVHIYLRFWGSEVLIFAMAAVGASFALPIVDDNMDNDEADSDDPDIVRISAAPLLFAWG